MALPFFYEENLAADTSLVNLNADASRHITQILRMKQGERLNLTDGKGNISTVEITSEHKKSTAVTIISTLQVQKPEKKVTIAISLLKNYSRFEWFVEKATEIGVTEIIPLICERTGKQRFRHERMKAIAISAMLQSQQAWLPLLIAPVQLNRLLQTADYPFKYIAHCSEEEKKWLGEYKVMRNSNALILIGPEGDFTAGEIKDALQNNFFPVSLGQTRLRTETAGIVACTLLCAG